MVLREGLSRAGVGIGLGLVPAWGLATLLSSWIDSGVTPTDAASYLLTVLVLGTTSFCAAVIPARRAATVDPIATLRTS
jgi:ABC-type antimicrobial peptide transport system permease subunit